MQASKRVTEEVNSCEDNDQMDKLVKCVIFISSVLVSPSLCRSYLSDGVLIVKKYKGPTPLSSTHHSHSSFETKKEMMKDMLREGDEPPQSYDQAKKNVTHVCTLRATNLLIQNNF